MTSHHSYGTRIRLASLSLGFGGLLMLIAGMVLMSSMEVKVVRADSIQANTVRAPLPDDAEYIGEGECSSCHRDISRIHEDTRHATTLQETKKANVVADFTVGEDVRQVQFPDEDSPRAFTEDDIAYVVGSGRNIQRYLYKVDRREYMVLPAEWNVAEQKWQPYTLAESWPDTSYDWNQNCAGCHTTGLDAERGIWEDDGVQCEACHGPGSLHDDYASDVGRNPSDEEVTQLRGLIVASPDPQICGQCHSQGMDTQADRPYPVSYRPGDDLLQNFTLSMPDDTAHWRASGHASSQNMQFNEWLQTGHANALTSVLNSDYADNSCLTCHSSDEQWTAQLTAAYEAGERPGAAPEAVTLETAQYGVTCTSCHDLHGDGEYDYQLADEPYALCVSCHADNRLEQVHHPVKEMFEGEAVIDQVSSVPSTHFAEGVQCETCHMSPTLETGTTWYSASHAMVPVLPGVAADGQPDSCTGCHTDLSPSYMQQFIENAQSGILDRLTNAQIAMGSRSSTPDWVTTALKFVSQDGSLGVHNYTYTVALLDAVDVELGTIKQTVPQNIPVHDIADPTTCAECHADQYNLWQTSPHANASLSQKFQQQFAESGQPSYCMSCHASGYDPRTQEYVFEGVTCSSCHYTTGNSEHPPGPVEVATNSAVCGQCHSGEHAPTYDEWLVSSHSTVGIDCADCHTAHDNGLILKDVNSTCTSCHAEAMTDEIHMGEDMTCVDCHMAKRVTADGVHVVQTGHTMSIDPGVCADCHGNIHLLSVGGKTISEQQLSELTDLQEQVTHLETAAEDNLNNGIVGGAIGALVLAVVAFLVIRLGRLR